MANVVQQRRRDKVVGRSRFLGQTGALERMLELGHPAVEVSDSTARLHELKKRVNKGLWSGKVSAKKIIHRASPFGGTALP
jgi:hypothetical protein